jgi:hypothetical protein
MLIKPSFSDVLRYGTSYKSVTTLAANTSEAVFSAAANVNGAILWKASSHSRNATGFTRTAYAAHTAAPNNLTVGDVLASNDAAMWVAGDFQFFTRVLTPIFIPAGKGVYFTADIAETACYRSALYTLY